MLIEYARKYKTISIIGMAKNAGKTVTLNSLLDEAYEENITIGLTSIGRDGEKSDIVTFTEKPMIYAYKNTLIATAEALFEVSEAKMEVLKITDFNTSMGKIIIGRVIDSGYVQIAGPCSNNDIKKVCEEMIALNVDLVVVDGAIDRKTSASPSITDGTILATGAIISRDMQKSIQKTVHQVSLFNIKKVEDTSIRTIADEAIRSKTITLVDKNNEVRMLDIKTALNAGVKISRNLNNLTEYVIIPGSLVNKTLRDIIETSDYYKNITVIIKDSTRIFIDYRDWIYFKRCGVEISVLDEIELMAVTINPYSISGHFYDSKTYKSQLESYVKPIPVINVLEG